MRPTSDAMRTSRVTPPVYRSEARLHRARELWYTCAMRHLVALLVPALGLLGCAPTETACDAEAAAACIVNQRSCTLLGGIPTCMPCETGTRVNTEGVCAPLAGTPLTHAFPEIAIEVGGEISGRCRSWTLNNEEEIWVNAVELSQDELSHHSNWTFVPDTAYVGDDGIWPCAERGYDQLGAALMGGVLYAQSTQASHEVQAFAAGAAIRLPPHVRIISDIHILNTTTAANTGNTELTLYTIPRSDVRVALVPFHIEYHALDIPARSDARFRADCELLPDIESALAGSSPFFLRMHYALPHTHALGTRVFLEAVGGAHDGEMILDVDGYNGEARGRLFDPPLELSDITGFRFGCEFQNPRDESVGYGIGDQEMCEMLGFIESPVAFESRVSTRTDLPSEDGMPVFGGACSNVVIPWMSRGL